MNVRTPAVGDGSLAQEWRGGWSTLLGATGAVAAGSAAFTYTASFFVKPLEAALGWSRAEIAFGAMLGQVTIAAAMPVAGWLTDRFGARIVALAGFVAYGLFCLALAAAPATLPVYYALLVGVALACGGTSAVVFNPLVVACFKRSRGTAIGITMSGGAFLLAPTSPFFLELIQTSGWRAGYAVLGVVALVMGLPCVWLASHKVGRVASRQVAAPGEEGMDLKQVIRTGAYWRMLAAVLTVTLPLGGFMHQLPALMSDKGLSVVEVGGLASLWVIMIAVGRTSVGPLLDILPPLRVTVALLLGTSAVVLWLVYSGPDLAVLAVITGLLGYMFGAQGPIKGFLTARQFGLPSFATIFGTFGACTSISFGLGALMFGALHDRYGGYVEALWVAAISFLISGLLFASLSPKRPAAPRLTPQPAQ